MMIPFLLLKGTFEFEGVAGLKG